MQFYNLNKLEKQISRLMTLGYMTHRQKAITEKVIKTLSQTAALDLHEVEVIKCVKWQGREYIFVLVNSNLRWTKQILKPISRQVQVIDVRKCNEMVEDPMNSLWQLVP